MKGISDIHLGILITVIFTFLAFFILTGALTVFIEAISATTKLFITKAIEAISGPFAGLIKTILPIFG